MDFADSQQRRIFFELHSGLPREGPGNRDSTARALAMAGSLPARPRILDIACGPGMQTMDLAALLPEARIVAVDTHEPFLEELQRRARAASAAHRIKADIRSIGEMRCVTRGMKYGARDQSGLSRRGSRGYPPFPDPWGTPAQC
jgi:SAM-dependent methyltransferase